MLFPSILLLFSLASAVSAQCNCANDCPAPASCGCRTRYIIVRPAVGSRCAPSCTPSAQQCSQASTSYANPAPPPATYTYPAPPTSYSYPAPAPAAPQVSYQSASQQVAPSYSSGGGGGGYSTGGGGTSYSTGGSDGYHARVHSFQQTQQVDGSMEGDSDKEDKEPIPSVDVGDSFAESDSRKARSSKTVSTDPKCNNLQLRKVMEEQMVAGNPNESKRQIHRATNGEADKGVDVICSTSAFSYRIATDLFCETTKGGVICFAFQHYNARR